MFFSEPSFQTLPKNTMSSFSEDSLLSFVNNTRNKSNIQIAELHIKVGRKYLKQRGIGSNIKKKPKPKVKDSGIEKLISNIKFHGNEGKVIAYYLYLTLQ